MINKSLNHLDGMRKCLEIIQEIRERYSKKYALEGSYDEMLIIEYVLCDIENKIGQMCYRNWKMK